MWGDCGSGYGRTGERTAREGSTLCDLLTSLDRHRKTPVLDRRTGVSVVSGPRPVRWTTRFSSGSSGLESEGELEGKPWLEPVGPEGRVPG